MAKGNDTSKPCPTKQRIGEFGIDEIYVSQNNNFTSATGWTHMGKDAITSHASDHTPVYVTMGLPGGDSSSSSSAGGLSWPVDVSWWKKDRSDFLNGHTAGSHTFTDPYWTDTASDISSPPAGTPVYSMLAGKVTYASSCDIQVTTSIQGGTLVVAYGHGNNHKVHVGDQVASGQQLDSEYHNCKATGDHVHVDMSFNGRHLCPQDVFLAMGQNQTPDFAALTQKVPKPTSCARV
jgi:biotin carboxyl carrier protein